VIFGPNFVKEIAASKSKYIIISKRQFQGWIIINAIFITIK